MANWHELHSFMVNDNVFDFENESESLFGSVVLYKVDADNNDIRLQDAVFRLKVWDASNSNWVSYLPDIDLLKFLRQALIESAAVILNLQSMRIAVWPLLSLLPQRIRCLQLVPLFKK